MKLFEIAPIPPERFTPRHSVKGLSKLGKPDDRAEKIGGGNYASAWSTKSEPGTVRKVITDRSGDLSNDAYFQYVRTITKNERLSKNPYFPKIYDVQVVRDKNFDLPAHSYFVDMERLHKMNTLSDEEALTIGRNLFDGFDSWMNQTLDGQKMYKTPRQGVIGYLRHLVAKRRHTSGVRTRTSVVRLIDNIKDPNLKQAVMFIKSVLRQNDRFFTDVHDENIMVRRGRHAPQLVFTDPLGG